MKNALVIQFGSAAYLFLELRRIYEALKEIKLSKLKLAIHDFA